MLDAKVSCTFCGASFDVSAPDPESLRDQVDGVGCWHTCCSVCKSPLLWHADRWWHLEHYPFSQLPKDLDPRGVDLDEDHEPVPAQAEHNDGQEAPDGL